MRIIMVIAPTRISKVGSIDRQEATVNPLYFELSERDAESAFALKPLQNSSSKKLQLIIDRQYTQKLKQLHLFGI